MAAHVLRDVDVVVDAYRLRGFMNSVAFNDACEPQECTVFGDTAKRRLAGLYSPALDMEGYWDAANDASVRSAAFNVADVPITVAPEGNTEGSLAFFFRALSAEYSHFGEVGQTNPFSMNALGSDGSRLVRGTIMHNATRSTSANGTARQLGAIASGKKMYAALHVLSASAADTLDVVIGSDDNSGFTSGTTRITFAQAATVGSQWRTLDGPVTDDWWRVQWTVGGSGISFEFIVVLGIL